ncbi:hypothetical protein Hrd1104_10055 [Halorhabdus sp. CBA1104]|uniref:DUF5810 domain-containing protein n=1 Tax=unclassified Halorhabdus TaxID=2621901 RepID=UPI0012B30A85|nr:MULTISPECIES: DUF5810 domain-containing protein [unclassified Halorhabdus]QGN07608.1 hypothetical protein Hrd1104_10055 [Halorhabdus sp. CBA1104]
MGYACPVCTSPQADAKHLADHLAFTALLGDDDHESWLEEHAPDWEDADDDSLAEQVLEYAEETELSRDSDPHDHTQGSPDATGKRADRPNGVTEIDTEEHEPGVAFDDFDEAVTADSNPPLDTDAQAALKEAYEMTRARRERGGRERADEGEDETGETE